MSADPSDLERQRRARAFLQRMEDGVLPLDGVMSPATRSLVDAFAATGVDMTTWWAWTEPDWQCPACGRRKPELVRLNQNGHLMCRLVEHHDHMQDLLLKRFREFSTSLSQVVADEFAERFAKRSAKMVSAYDNTIVCNDCNNADVLGKKAANAHPDFSFSSQELRRFINARANAAHTIQPDVAALVWQKQAETFSLRLCIVDRIAEIAAKNTHWFQAGEITASPAIVEARAKAVASSMDAPAGVLYDLCGPPKSNRSADTSAWRRKNYPAARRRPTAGDIAHAVQVVAPGLWNALPDGWVCPGCAREKTTTIRPSASNAWSFTARTKYLGGSAAGRQGAAVLLCGDCAWTIERLRAEVTAALRSEDGGLPWSPSLADIVSIIKPQPYSRHNFDNAIADKLVRRLCKDLAGRAFEPQSKNT
jgi:rubredoxin